MSSTTILNKNRAPRQVLTSLVVAIALLCTTSLLGAAHAADLTEEETLAKRTQWQDKYRMMLTNRAILIDNIAKLNHDYAQAQRRNYPRGGARDQLRTQAAEAEIELARLEEQIAGIFAEARADEVPPGWLYEIEEEPIDPSQPASPGDADQAEDREGRNPLYFEDDDEGEDS